MITMPKLQEEHNYISKKIQPWLDLHFPEDSAYYGRIFIGQRHRGTSGIYDLSRRNIDELGLFVPKMHISSRLDYYITANAFSGIKREAEGLFALHNIVIDVDCHGEDVDESPAELAQTFVWLCSRDLWTTGIMPEPNSVVMTGRGVQLWWAIDPISAKLEWIYRRIQRWIMDTMEDLIDENERRLQGLSIDRGASSNLAGWFRLPVTYNTVAKRWGSLKIRNERRYSHQELLDAIPAEYRPRYEQNCVKTGEQRVYIPLAATDSDVMQNGTSIMARRVYQMIKLRALRDAAVGAENRDELCLVTYSALLADYEPEEAWRRLLAFNAGFKEPFKIRVLKRKMSHAALKKYKMSNEKVIERLRITEEEQDAIGLYPAGTNVKKSKTQNYTRDLLRQAAREDRDMKILALFFAGQSKAAIARELGISRNTVFNVVNSEKAAQNAAKAALEEDSSEVEVDAAVGAGPVPVMESKVLKNGALLFVSYVSHEAGEGCCSSLMGLPGGASGDTS